MILVSVILPFFNAAPYLERTILSVLSQTYPNVELIMIDDGSTDQSQEIVKQYVKDFKVKLLIQKNAGAAIARNTGLLNASGTFIQFLDAGDVISQDKIEKQLDFIKEDPEKVAVCNYRLFTTETDLDSHAMPDQSSFIYSTDDPQEFLINLWGGYGKRNFIQTNCWLVSKSLIEKAGQWRAYRCPDDDGEFFSRVLLASRGIIHTPGVYNYYHAPEKGVNQLSKNKHLKYLKNTLLTIALKHKYLLQKGNHPKINAAMASQYLVFAIDTYPRYPILWKIAYRRYKQFHVKVALPVLGGIWIEGIKTIFGWKSARCIKYIMGRG